MSKGLCSAFQQAEKHCQKEKSKKKIRNRQIVFKENSSEILVEELNAMLAQLRIHVDELSNEQKALLKNNITTSFEDSLRTPIGISEDVKKFLLESKNQDFIQQRINVLDQKLLLTLPNSITAEQRANYILGNILSRTPIDTIEKFDYFFQKHADYLVSSDNKRTFQKLSKQALVTLEISGIKDVNDTYGHTQCDQMVYQLVSQVQDLLNNLEIKKDSPIFAYNISSYGLLIPATERKHISKLCTAISSLDSEFKVAVSSTKLGENIDSHALTDFLSDKEKKPTDLLFHLLNLANANNMEQNKRSISVQKINDKKSMSRYISRNLKRITKSLGQEIDLKMLNSALKQILGNETSLSGQSVLSNKGHISPNESRKYHSEEK